MKAKIERHKIPRWKRKPKKRRIALISKRWESFALPFAREWRASSLSGECWVRPAPTLWCLRPPSQRLTNQRLMANIFMSAFYPSSHLGLSKFHEREVKSGISRNYSIWPNHLSKAITRIESGQPECSLLVTPVLSRVSAPFSGWPREHPYKWSHRMRVWMLSNWPSSPSCRENSHMSHMNTQPFSIQDSSWFNNACARSGKIWNHGEKWIQSVRLQDQQREIMPCREGPESYTKAICWARCCRIRPVGIYFSGTMRDLRASKVYIPR